MTTTETAQDTNAGASPAASPGTGAPRDPRRWWVLGAMCFALFMAMLDNTVVNVAIPTIRKDLNASLSHIQWIVDAYTLAFASLMLTGGALGDIFGRKKAFVGGLAVFSAGSVVAALAPTSGWLIAGRTLTGIGAALLMPGTLAIITATFDEAERPMAIGTWAGFSGLALALGPVIGGTMVERIGWQSVFWLNVPIGVVGVVVAVLVVRESRDTSGTRKLDPLGLVLGSAMLFALVYGLIEANTKGWGDPVILGSFAVAAGLFVPFVIWERRVASPMINLRFFRNATFASANSVAFIVSFAMFGIFLYISLFIQNVQGYSPAAAGVRFLPMTLMIIMFAPLAGRMSGRIGSSRLMALGLGSCAVGLFFLSGIRVDTPYSHLVWQMMLMGFGMALVMSPMTAAVMQSVDTRMAGIASATTNTSREVGGTFGVALLGTIVSSLASAAFPRALAKTAVPPARRAKLV